MSAPLIDLRNLCIRVRTFAVQFPSLKSPDVRFAALEQFWLLAILVLAPIGWSQIARKSLVCEAAWSMLAPNFLRPTRFQATRNWPGPPIPKPRYSTTHIFDGSIWT